MTRLTLLQASGKGPSWPAETRSVDLDWLTCTASTDGSSEALWQCGERILTDNEAVGYVPTRWQAHGYRGWCSDGIRLGSRLSGSIVSMSGLKCRENWKQALSAAEHCSRIDVAVDVYLNPEVPSLTRDVYQTLFHKPPGNGRPAKRTLILNSDGGSTLYIGSRVSDRFARIYDKGIEQQTAPAGNWYRFELEVKGDSSHPFADQLLRIEDYKAALLGTVAHYFRERSALAIPHGKKFVIRNESRPAPTDARRLHWLSSQVRGTVLELTRSVGTARVLEALGLPTSAVRDS